VTSLSGGFRRQERAVELLKKRRWLLNYGREVSVVVRLSHAEKQALEQAIIQDRMPLRVMAIKRMRSFIGKVVPKAHRSPDRVDGEALGLGTWRLSDAACLHVAGSYGGQSRRGHATRLRGPAGLKESPPRQLFRAVCENCGDSNSEGCKLTLLKLYYLHH